MDTSEGGVQFQTLTVPFVEEATSLLRHGCFSTLTNTFQRITWSQKVFVALCLLLGARLLTGSFDLACHVTLLLLFLAYGLAWAATLYYAYGPPLHDMRVAKTTYIDAEDANFWIAIANRRVVACVAIVPKDRPFKDSSYRRAAWLRRMVVHEAFRGRGLAKSLLTRALHFARSNGYEAVELITSDLHVEARALYLHSGFREHARRLYWYGPACVRTFEFVYVFREKDGRYSDVD